MGSEGLAKIAEKAPNFNQVIEHICAQSRFQRKAIERTFGDADGTLIAFAEGLVGRIIKALDQGQSHEYLAKAYVEYTKAIRIEEMYFAKEGKYRMSSFDEVNEKVYSRDDYMVDYVVGLGLTQIFWANHYQIVRFYLDHFIPLIKTNQCGAEVGVGHGLFHTEMLLGAPNMKSTMLDISPTSLSMTHKMIAAAGLEPDRAEEKLCDIQKGIPLDDGSLDTLLMGELIEHIENGEAVLAGFTKKMKPGGLCFFTTAANAPAEDHILLFRTVGEIHDVIKGAGWAIEKEHLGTLNGMSVEEAEKDGHNINFAAILSVDNG